MVIVPKEIVANGARAYAAATVVTSSMLTKVEPLRLLQGPTIAARAIAEFVPAPGLPPVESR